jgi:hypothetical protein
MVDVITAQATIAKVVKGYRVIVEIRKGARAYVVVNKIAASTIDAEAVAKTFTAEHGVPWHTVAVLYRCPSSDILRQIAVRSKGGSGASVE